jgi:major membrane immunogen (membrane-anchored lipoprotein)
LRQLFSCLFLLTDEITLIKKSKFMKLTFLRNAFMVAALVGGLSLTSCKKETETKTETETTIMDGDTVSATETEVLDETGAKDTIAVTTDTVKVVKP